MNDRELLTLAAKAAGIEVAYWNDGSEPYSSGEGFVLASNRIWNPLTADGVALRLAVQLELKIYHSWDETVNVYVGYSTPGAKHRTLYMIEKHGSDARWATRRAIVRAAAEIGKEMK